MNNLFMLLFVCGIGLFAPLLTKAQMLNVDAPETVSDSSNLINKVTDHVKEAQKNIENSQFGKAVGDGVKYAKQGLSYAQDGYAEAMKYYNQGMAYKDEFLNSPEFKISQKSAQIAMLKAQIKEAEKQEQQAQQKTEEKINLVQSEADAKIKNLNQNLANTKILMADGDNEQARQMAQNINDEIAQIKKEAADKVSALQSELPQKPGKVPSENKSEDEAVNEGAESDENAMAWEISGQNQDDVVAVLKPGVQMADTLQTKAETPQLLQRAQASKTLDAASTAMKTEPILQQRTATEKRIGLKKTKDVSAALKTGVQKQIQPVQEAVPTTKAFQRAAAKQPLRLKQGSAAKKVLTPQKAAVTTMKRIGE